MKTNYKNIKVRGFSFDLALYYRFGSHKYIVEP